MQICHQCNQHTEALLLYYLSVCSDWPVKGDVCSDWPAMRNSTLASCVNVTCVPIGLLCDMCPDWPAV